MFMWEEGKIIVFVDTEERARKLLEEYSESVPEEKPYVCDCDSGDELVLIKKEQK